MASIAPGPISEPIPNGGYRWILTAEEREHIALMLDCNPSNISIKSTLMVQDRELCTGCGKPTGLDDLVENALSRGIHSPEFMADVLHNGPKSESPGHEVNCSRCGVKFTGVEGFDLERRKSLEAELSTAVTFI
ncbi:hypothetical protein BJY04DRAFT_216679 [Aspergillus karnatakaensis]|uniref:uncharacterized protein n=1 Tax=Aspergillus karnatakaensis TaxID=1810916 RepID=UPI003CCE1096